MAIWALPENLEDMLPADAAALERIRRIALDTFASRGYELVVPPLIEYVESLLSGVGNDMDLATFKLVDQLSGRMMGIRADTTPQVARIDAHVLNRAGVTRLCYAGSVLHTRASGLGKSRQPFQAGAELYGYAGLDADIEVQQLMLDTLTAFGVGAVRLDIGHPGIFRALAAGLENAAREEVFVQLAAKDMAALDSIAEAANTESARALALLANLYGADANAVIARARAVLPALPAIREALDQLSRIAAHFGAQGLQVSVDLGELGGYNYESGIAFSAYATGASEAVARGGRYDDVGRAFGRARPATGFSMDLKSLLPLIVADTEPTHMLIVVAAGDVAAAAAAIAEFRDAGEAVLTLLPDESADVVGATHVLKRVNGGWQAVPL